MQITVVFLTKIVQVGLKKAEIECKFNFMYFFQKPYLDKIFFKFSFAKR